MCYFVSLQSDPIGERRLERSSLAMDRSLRNTHLMKYKLPSKDELRARLAALPAQAADVLSSRKFWYELVLMTVAMFIGAMAVHYFLAPSGLIVGSVTGLGIVLERLLPVMSLGSYMFLINAILLLLSFILIGNEFGAKTCYTALILGPFVDLMGWIDPVEGSMFAQEVHGVVVANPGFDLVCFILVMSAAQAILFSINASTGGLDILAKIFNKFLHVPLGVSVTIAGGLICCSAFLTSPTGLVIMGLVGTWLNGLILDYFMTRMSSRTRVYVISKDWEHIRDYVIHTLNRGVTIHPVTGGYSGEDHKQLECILTRDEFGKLLDHLRAERMEPFITSDPVSEVYGLWRKKSQREELTVETGTPDESTF